MEIGTGFPSEERIRTRAGLFSVCEELEEPGDWDSSFDLGLQFYQDPIANFRALSLKALLFNINILELHMVNYLSTKQSEPIQ